MTELAEPIAIGGLPGEIEIKCPFADETLGVDSIEGEDIARDDRAAARAQQSNNGGVLGANLESASPGKDGTVGGPYPPPTVEKSPRLDTRRKKLRVRVPGTATIPEGIYGFTVAAHHLIPGEASLAPSKLKPFMEKGGSVEVVGEKGKKTKKVRKHIGYNVNGAHNGVWLPGNYYIRSRTSPIKGKTWSALGDDAWCLHYVAAVSMAASGQIHDAHKKYSAAVEELLNKIAKILSQHECDQCNKPDINPPFEIKNRLYNLSRFLKTQLTAPPAAWSRPWFTSDRWRKAAFDAGQPSKEFAAAYRDAGLVDAISALRMRGR